MRITEIFYSIQGEGYWTGRPAVFVRFAGCNLHCSFCDTDFMVKKEMSEDEIVDEVCQYGCNMVVLTGGEPTLQVTPSLLDKLHKRCKYIAMESNGTKSPEWLKDVDWITISPKTMYNDCQLAVNRCDEVKVVVNENTDAELLYNIKKLICADHYYLQPCDTGISYLNEEHIKHTVELVKDIKIWRISLQTQKMLNVQ